MPLDKSIQDYVTRYGFDEIEAHNLDDEQKNFLISKNIQYLIKHLVLSPKEALSISKRAFNIVRFSNIGKLIVLEKLNLAKALLMYREDCEKLEIDTLFILVAEDFVDIQTIIKLEEAQVTLLRNESLIDLIRERILSFEQAIQLNPINSRYFFQKSF
jgi:hypothetical protein